MIRRLNRRFLTSAIAIHGGASLIAFGAVHAGANDIGSSAAAVDAIQIEELPSTIRGGWKAEDLSLDNEKQAEQGPQSQFLNDDKGLRLVSFPSN